MNLIQTIKTNRLKIFIICRINSKRLPQKIKKTILNLSLLEILILRLGKKFGNQNIIICTSGKKNNFYTNIVKKYNVKIFYGDEKNIFKRLLDASKKFKVKNFVRVTGDNPLTDTDILAKMILVFIKKKLDYVYTNGLFPGLRSEVFSIKSLKKCYEIAEDPTSSEYLTYFFLRKSLFNIFCYKKKVIKKENFLSITIDTKQDFENLKKLIKFKKDIFISRLEIINRLKHSKKNIIKKLIPLKTKFYNVRLKTDLENMKFIKLKDFSL